MSDNVAFDAGKKPSEWELRTEELHEAQVSELRDIQRHRAVAEKCWLLDSERLAGHRATIDAQNERLVASQERIATALERIAEHVMKPPLTFVPIRSEP